MIQEIFSVIGSILLNVTSLALRKPLLVSPCLLYVSNSLTCIYGLDFSADIQIFSSTTKSGHFIELIWWTQVPQQLHGRHKRKHIVVNNKNPVVIVNFIFFGWEFSHDYLDLIDIQEHFKVWFSLIFDYSYYLYFNLKT